MGPAKTLLMNIFVREKTKRERRYDWLADRKHCFPNCEACVGVLWYSKYPKKRML